MAGFTPEFQSALDRMLADAPGLTIKSGYRSPERQAQLYANAIRKYGSESAARHWVAPPGHSYHNKGLAADLGFSNDAQREWAHQNAAKYGLYFPMGHEPWHVELRGTRGGNVAGGDTLSGGSSSGTMLGGLREGGDALGFRGNQGDKGFAPIPIEEPVRVVIPKKHTDPLPQTSGRIDPVAMADHEMLSPSMAGRDPRSAVVNSLRGGGGGRPLFGPANSNSMIALKPGFTRFFGIGHGYDGSMVYTPSQQMKAMARLGADWASKPPEVIAQALYGDGKKSGGLGPKEFSHTDNQRIDAMVAAGLLPQNATYEQKVTALHPGKPPPKPKAGGLGPHDFSRTEQQKIDALVASGQLPANATYEQKVTALRLPKQKEAPVLSDQNRASMIRAAKKLIAGGKMTVDKLLPNLEQYGITADDLR